MVKKQTRKCHIDILGEVVTIQCLTIPIKMAKVAWDYKKGAVKKVKEDVPGEVTSQPTPGS